MCTPQIASYIHCGKCLEELPSDQSPAEYADYSVGFTRLGIQVFCNRHQVNVVHVDLSRSSSDKVLIDGSLEGNFE